MRKEHTMSNWVGSLPLPPKKPDNERPTGKTRQNASSKSSSRSPPKSRKAIGNDGKSDPPRKLQPLPPPKPPPPSPPPPPPAVKVQVPKEVNSNLLCTSITMSKLGCFFWSFQPKNVFKHPRPLDIRARGEGFSGLMLGFDKLSLKLKLLRASSTLKLSIV